MITSCNLVSMYVHKLYEKFGGCKKSVSWKVNKNINAMILMTLTRTCGHGMTPSCRSRQDISTVFNILIKFQATDTSYSVRLILEISRIFDSIFVSSKIPDLSYLYYVNCILKVLS